MLASGPEHSLDRRSRRVLVVEDNQAACTGLARLLEASGYTVTAVADGASALRVLASERPPDYLLTDMQLPDFDGREVALRARQLKPPPTVALITGWDLENGCDCGASWGIDWVMTKPLDFRALILKMSECDDYGVGSFERRV
jgi:two-component system cell cycle response regulator CpdR